MNKPFRNIFVRTLPVMLIIVLITVLISAWFLTGPYTKDVLAQNKTDSSSQAQTPNINQNKDQTTTQTPASSKATAQSSVSKSSLSDAGGGFVICGNKADDPCNITHLFRGMVVIINYLISMAGLVAMLFIVYAGVLMAASRGVEAELSVAKQRMNGAVIGLVIVALAFVLINTILSGTLNVGLGIKDGGLILTNPKQYINQ